MPDIVGRAVIGCAEIAAIKRRVGALPTPAIMLL